MLTGSYANRTVFRNVAKTPVQQEPNSSESEPLTNPLAEPPSGFGPSPPSPNPYPFVGTRNVDLPCQLLEVRRIREEKIGHALCVTCLPPHKPVNPERIGSNLGQRRPASPLGEASAPTGGRNSGLGLVERGALLRRFWLEPPRNTAPSPFLTWHPDLDLLDGKKRPGETNTFWGGSDVFARMWLFLCFPLFFLFFAVS